MGMIFSENAIHDVIVTGQASDLHPRAKVNNGNMIRDKCDDIGVALDEPSRLNFFF